MFQKNNILDRNFKITNCQLFIDAIIGYIVCCQKNEFFKSLHNTFASVLHDVEVLEKF